MAARVCMAVGVPHPDLLWRILTAQQMNEWTAFFRQHPFGFDVDQSMLAQLSVLIAANGGVRSSVSDFMPAIAEPVDDDDAIAESNDDLDAMFPGGSAIAKRLRETETDGDHCQS